MPRPGGTTRGREDVDLPCDATERPSPHRATALDWAAPVDLSRFATSLVLVGTYAGDTAAEAQID